MKMAEGKKISSEKEDRCMPDRPSIPQKIVDNLMFVNDHSCCLCREKGKHVQIHHIDGDVSNNNPTNLAVLCLECHSKVTGNEGLGRRYAPGKIVQYKKTWELAAKGKLVGKRIAREPRNKAMSYFELTACEILAMDDGDSRIREKIGTLYQLNTVTGCTDKILDCLFHLAIQSSMSQKETAKMLWELIYQLFWHFVGPDAIAFRKNDVKRLEQGIDLLGTIGQFNGEFSKDIEVIKAVCDNLYNVFEIAVWYDLEKVGISVVNKLEKTKECCLLAFEDSEKPLNEGAQYASQTIVMTQERMEKASLKWNPLQI